MTTSYTTNYGFPKAEPDVDTDWPEQINAAMDAIDLQIAGVGEEAASANVTPDDPLPVPTVARLVAGRASAAAPTDVSADGDAVAAWRLRNGAEAVVITAAGALVGGDVGNGLDVDVTRVGGNVTVVDGGGSLTVDGTVAISGTVAVTDNSSTLSVDDGGGSITVDGSVTASLAAGANNIGDVDVLTVPVPLSTSGGGTEATALRVTVATDSTGVLSVDDNGGNLSVDDGGGSLTVDGTVAISGTVAVTDNSSTLSVDDGGGSITVDGSVTASLAAGANNIGDVDVLTVPAPLSTTGGGTEATALRVTVATDSTGVLSVDDNGGNLSVDDGGGSLTVDGTVAISGTVAVTDNSSTLSVDDGGGSITVDGSVTANPTQRTLTWVTGTCASSGDNSIVAAPGVGVKIVVKHLIMQNETTTATTIIARDGTTSKIRVYAKNQGDGLTMQFENGSEWRLTNNTALQINLSGANTCGYTFAYWTE